MDFRRAEAPDCPELAALMSDALSGYPIYTAAQEYLKPGVDSREMLMSINRTLCNFFMRYNKACFIALDEGNIAGEIMLEAPGEAEFNKRTATLCGGLDTLKFMKVKRENVPDTDNARGVKEHARAGGLIYTEYSRTRIVARAGLGAQAGIRLRRAVCAQEGLQAADAGGKYRKARGHVPAYGV